MNTEVISAPLRVKEKLGFASVDAGFNLINNFLLTFYLIYLTDVAGIPAAAAGTLFFVTRLFNGINDPITGYIMDKYRLPMKWGKFRTWLFLAAPAIFISVILLFTIPDLSTTGKLIYLYCIIMLHDLVTDFISTPLSSLMANSTQNIQERSNIAGFRGIAVSIIAIIAPFGAIVIKNSFASPQTGWIVAAIIFAILSCAGLFLGTINIKERVQSDTEASYNFREGLGIVAKNKPMLILTLASLAFNIYFSIALTARIYYFTYYIKNEALFAPMAGLGVIFTIIGMVLSLMIAKRIGKRRTAILGGVIMVIGHIVLYFVPPAALGLLAITLIAVCFGTGLISIMLIAIMPDTIEYSEWKTGFRAEGIINSLNSFLTKLGGAFGGAISGWILSATGYVPNALQSPVALQGILLTISFIPAIMVAIAVFAFWLYSFDESKYAEAVSVLAQRKTIS